MHREPRGLFGRDRELTEADEALELAASGTPQVLLMGGDAGIGKTTWRGPSPSVPVLVASSS